jgi:hypothetical protein
MAIEGLYAWVREGEVVVGDTAPEDDESFATLGLYHGLRESGLVAHFETQGALTMTRGEYLVVIGGPRRLRGALQLAILQVEELAHACAREGLRAGTYKPRGEHEAGEREFQWLETKLGRRPAQPERFAFSLTLRVAINEGLG